MALRAGKMSIVECEVNLVKVNHYESGRLIDGLRVTCGHCGNVAVAAGTGEASVRRACVELRESCPRHENNFYAGENREGLGVSMGDLAQRVMLAPEIVPELAAAASPIVSFRNEHAFLSNFVPALVLYDGYRYPTAEHAFQAAKVGGSEDEIEVFRREIREANSLGKAKALGRQITLRSDWEQVKFAIMLQ